MPKGPRLREKLTYSNVVSTICLFLLLGGGAAYAASNLAKNSVGGKQLKKNAVTTAKIKNGAVTGAKIANGTITGTNVANGSLTGTQINAATLGTVPTAHSANTAERAGSADEANTADTAKSLAPPEPWHEVGVPGEPPFLNGWQDVGSGEETVAFFKDHEGVVHLRGFAKSGSGAVFQLPPGYRPTSGRFLEFPMVCYGCGTEAEVGVVDGPGQGANNGEVFGPPGTSFGLDGVTFRAEP
jgi:hypothetical protein